MAYGLYALRFVFFAFILISSNGFSLILKQKKKRKKNQQWTGFFFSFLILELNILCMDGCMFFLLKNYI